MSTVLPAQTRGATFDYTFTLGNGWKGSDFTGGVKFTLRTKIPDSDVLDDSNIVGQAYYPGGGITFTGGDPDEGTIKISAADTKGWPACRELFWDLKGEITAVPVVVHPIDAGKIPIVGDVTRSMPA